MAESSGQTRISRYIGLYSAESTITHAKSSLRLFLGSAIGRKLITGALEAAEPPARYRTGLVDEKIAMPSDPSRTPTEYRNAATGCDSSVPS